jgi:hypothetical protein
MSPLTREGSSETSQKRRAATSNARDFRPYRRAGFVRRLEPEAR